MSAEGEIIMAHLIDERRLLEDIFAQGRIGWDEATGLQRVSYSPAYIVARDWLQRRMKEAGLETRVDGVGNLFGRLEGKNKKTILMGSHLDSVNNGGIYDGPLGIIAAFEVLRAMKEKGYTPNHSLEVVAFIAEEGEPLGGTFGSRVFAGQIPKGYKRDILSSYGIREYDVHASRGDIANYAGFIELHIEQGPFLERAGLSIGVPSGIVGITRLEVTILGEANHAGTTPMSERKDAMRSAAVLIDRWFQWMDGRQNLVCNIGVISISPAHVSIVPEEVRFTLELRSADDAAVKNACLKFGEMAKNISPCSASITLLGNKPAVMLDETLVKTIKQCADDAGLPSVVMASGASHDSAPIAHVIPTGMIFVPNKNGISHSKDEFTKKADIINGAKLLADVITELDRRAC